MSASSIQVNRARRSYAKLALIGVLFGAAFVAFLFTVQPFLAINRTVDADILVIEGWIPSYALHTPARDLKSGYYKRVFVSGLFYEKGDENYHYGSDPARIAADLEELGVSSSLIEPCPIPTPRFNRTSHMAREVGKRIRALGWKPRGIKVVTLGSHARQSLVAYQRMLGDLAPVGIVAYPDTRYDAARWWTSIPGIKKTAKDLAGWLKESAVGLRS